jgi:non-ribosomal peptide synthetase component E (peptide arylation enzyme)
MEIFRAIEAQAHLTPDHPALIDDSGMVSWGELPQMIDRIGLGLVHAGMRRDNYVAILTGRSCKQALAILGVMRGGGVALPLIPSLGDEANLSILAATPAKDMIYEYSYADLARQISLEYEMRSAVHLGPSLEDKHVSWETLEKTEVEGARFPVMPGNTPVLLTYGTDAENNLRGGVANLDNLWRSVTPAVRGLNLPPSCRTLMAFPAGLHAHEILLRTIRLGGTAVFSDSLHPREVSASVAKNLISVIAAPPCYFQAFFDYLEKENLTLPSLQLLEARGHTSPELARRARALLGIPLVSTWSCPESLGPVLCSSRDEDGSRALYLQACPGIMEQVVDASRHPVREGETGMLLISSSSCAAKSISPGLDESSIDEDKWIHTLHVARRTGREQLSLLGNRYDAVLRDGVKTYPRLTAELLENIPGVHEAEPVLLYGEPGCVTMAMALIADAKLQNEGEKIMQAIRKYLSSSQRPDRIVIMNSFPRNPDGTVAADKLREIVARLPAPVKNPAQGAPDA